MSNCNFYRDEHYSNYTCLNNKIWQDKNLSFQAKGFLGWLLSLPESWNFSYAGISKVTGLSNSTIKRLLKELANAHYFKMEKLNPNQTHNGRFEYVYNIFETPYDD